MLEKKKEERFNAFSEMLRELDKIFAANCHKKYKSVQRDFSKIK